MEIIRLISIFPATELGVGRARLPQPPSAGRLLQQWLECRVQAKQALGLVCVEFVQFLAQIHNTVALL